MYTATVIAYPAALKFQAAGKQTMTETNMRDAGRYFLCITHKLTPDCGLVNGSTFPGDRTKGNVEI